MDKQRFERVKLAMLAMQRYQWEQGVAAQALLEMGESDLAVLMAKEAVHRQAEDGRLAVMGPNIPIADPSANGEAVLYAARVTGDAGLRQGAERMLDYLLNQAPRADNGVILHNLDPQQTWVWIDAMYMVPPFLSAAGQHEEAVRQVEGMHELMFDPQRLLYRHIWDARGKTWVREAPWGGGNGWVASGIARVLGTLPPEMVDARQRLAGYARAVIEGCLRYQRADGLFHDVVDDPSTFVETNLAQMLAYGIYRGLAGGWLAPSFLPAATRLRAAANLKVDEWGLVQDAAAAPAFDRPGVSTEAQAFCLLMEAWAEKVA